MKKISEPIVFFGSGPVAAQALKLLSDEFEIESVITKPQKSRDSDPVPVMDLARELGLDVLLPVNRQELDELFKDKPVSSRLAILIDYGIIVSQSVIDYFPLGIVNSHFSLLPQWRGADPITFSILSGQSETGVSLMLLNAKMDEGDLLAQAKVAIKADSNSVTLTNELIELSHQLLVEHIPRYVDGILKPYPQPNEPVVSYSHKLTKSDGEIDWHKSATQIEREIRAYITWPKSFTKVKDIDIIITKASVIDENGEAGTYKIANRKLIFNCGDGSLAIESLKPANKKEMDIAGFLAGYQNLI